MAVFGNTQTIVLPAGTMVLVKVDASRRYSAEYYLRSGATEYRLIIRHSYPNKRKNEVSVVRHNAEFTVTTAPTPPALDADVRRVYFVFENPIGITMDSIVAGLFDWALANTREAIQNMHQMQS